MVWIRELRSKSRKKNKLVKCRSLAGVTKSSAVGHKKRVGCKERVTKLTEGMAMHMTGIYTFWHIAEPSLTGKSCCVCSEDKDA
jgi:hypothetical protein